MESHQTRRSAQIDACRAIVYRSPLPPAYSTRRKGAGPGNDGVPPSAWGQVWRGAAAAALVVRATGNPLASPNLHAELSARAIVGRRTDAPPGSHYVQTGAGSVAGSALHPVRARSQTPNSAIGNRGPTQPGPLHASPPTSGPQGSAPAHARRLSRSPSIRGAVPTARHEDHPIIVRGRRPFPGPGLWAPRSPCGAIPASVLGPRARLPIRPSAGYRPPSFGQSHDA